MIYDQVDDTLTQTVAHIDKAWQKLQYIEEQSELPLIKQKEALYDLSQSISMLYKDVTGQKQESDWLAYNEELLTCKDILTRDWAHDGLLKSENWIHDYLADDKLDTPDEWSSISSGFTKYATDKVTPSNEQLQALRNENLPADEIFCTIITLPNLDNNDKTLAQYCPKFIRTTKAKAFYLQLVLSNAFSSEAAILIPYEILPTIKFRSATCDEHIWSNVLKWKRINKDGPVVDDPDQRRNGSRSRTIVIGWLDIAIINQLNQASQSQSPRTEVIEPEKLASPELITEQPNTPPIITREQPKQPSEKNIKIELDEQNLSSFKTILKLQPLKLSELNKSIDAFNTYYDKQAMFVLPKVAGLKRKRGGVSLCSVLLKRRFFEELAKNSKGCIQIKQVDDQSENQPTSRKYNIDWEKKEAKELDICAAFSNGRFMKLPSFKKVNKMDIEADIEFSIVE